MVRGRARMGVAELRYQRDSGRTDAVPLIERERTAGLHGAGGPRLRTGARARPRALPRRDWRHVFFAPDAMPRRLRTYRFRHDDDSRQELAPLVLHRRPGHLAALNTEEVIRAERNR